MMLRYVSGVALTCIAINADAYESVTHALLTSRAYSQSCLGRPDLSAPLLADLGLKIGSPSDAFGNVYYDVFASTQIRERIADDPAFPPASYEAKVFEQVAPPIELLSIRGWLARGTLREDDLPEGIGASGNPNKPDEDQRNPQDDTCTNGERPCYRLVHHFWDPYRRRGLSFQVPGGGTSVPFPPQSPEWAIGVVDAFQQPLMAQTVRENHFSIMDARESMWRALTLKRSDSAIPPGFIDIYSPGSGDPADKERVRARYWATVFRSLGDAIHVLQDMAQPQHSRVDSHFTGGVYGEGGGSFAGHKSFYENYIEARARQLDFKFKDAAGVERFVTPLPLPNSNSYPYDPPRFTTYADYWSTARDWSSGTANASLNGRGLADYASRGFYTAGTNIASGASRGGMFPQPTQVEAQLNKVDEFDPVNIMGDKLTGKVIQLIRGTVVDSISSTKNATDAPLSSEGAFDQFLTANLQRHYTLTTYNYDEQARLLLPRAAAYSAGLIDYFFRGKLQIGVPNEGVYSIVDQRKQSNSETQGFRKLKVKVANLTPSIIPSGTSVEEVQAMTAGKMVAVVKFHRNPCYTADLTHEYKDPEGNESFSCRSIEEEIVVSDPMGVTDIPGIPAGGNFEALGQDILFTFSSAIPINATDLYLQVVYRGILGSEADAVVVTTKDIPEPTYFSVVNVTDYVFCYASHFYFRSANGDYNNASLPYPPAAPGETIAPLPSQEPFEVKTKTYGTYRLAFEPNSASTPIATAVVAKNQYAQVAVLTDFGRKVSRGIEGESFSLTPTSFLPGINHGASAFRPETLRNLRTHYPLFAARNGGGGSCAAIPIGTEGHQHPYGPEPGFITGTPVREMVDATISLPFNTP
jgi:hypothetical protein